MNLSFMQFLSPKFGIVVGKLYTLGADDNEFAHDFHSSRIPHGADEDQGGPSVGGTAGLWVATRRRPHAPEVPRLGDSLSATGEVMTARERIVIRLREVGKLSWRIPIENP
jgi:hypothetical protein